MQEQALAVLKKVQRFNRSRIQRKCSGGLQTSIKKLWKAEAFLYKGKIRFSNSRIEYRWWNRHLVCSVRQDA